MRKVEFIEANDIHLRGDNVETIKDLIKQMCDLSDTHLCDKLLILGDILETRPAQNQGVLVSLIEILDYIKVRGKKLFTIPGNHDKADYSSDNSFLLPYQNHPALFLMSQPTYLKADGCDFDSYFLPFYEEKTWIDKFENMIKLNPVKNKSILFGHWAVIGSQNNNGTTVDNGIKPSLFKKFHKVFLGHYHNSHTIGSNIFHLPSIIQANFGEDNQKGFTLIYNNGEHEFVKSSFKEFVTIKVDVENLTAKEIKEFAKQTDSNTRIEITGDKAKLAAIDTTLLRDSGIKVVKKDIEFEIADIEQVSEVKIHNKETVIIEFQNWCKSEKIDSVNGLKYLK
jgi:exonuclease SbcD